MLDKTSTIIAILAERLVTTFLFHQCIIILMTEKDRQPYEAPLAMVFEFRQESIICESGGLEDYKPQPLQNW